MKLIPLDAVVADIDKRKNLCEKIVLDLRTKENKDYYQGKVDALNDTLSCLDTLEVKEIDLEEEYKSFLRNDNGRSMFETAKHFFELGVRVNNPITATDRGTAEEIIINLKRVEQDYRIVLTREIEWLRNKVHKGEKL